MIIVTGGAGFIGSAIVYQLNQSGRKDIIIVDNLGKEEKWKNIRNLDFLDIYSIQSFVDSFRLNENLPKGLSADKITAIIHMGANSSTTEKDADHLLDNNFKFSVSLAKFSINHNKRFIYASSAATYGDGNLGFEDKHNIIPELKPLNMYGYSKNLFDKWLLFNNLLDKVVGLKFFNVYGPNEYHKGDMRSVVHKAYEQIRDVGFVKLFKSLHPNYKHGEQLRDFIYVKDAVKMTLFFLNSPNANGIFNIGTGTPRSWKDLVTAIFTAMNKETNIEFIDLPDHLKDKYQYYTEANINKLKNSGYHDVTYSLEEGVRDYVQNYLLKEPYLSN